MGVPVLWPVAIFPSWGFPTLLSWDQALSFLLTRCLLLNLFPLSCCCGGGFFVEGPPGFRDQALSCLAATQVLLAFVCLIACLLVVSELTWMLPGSRLRYHEKIHGTVTVAVAVRAFCTFGTWLKALCWARCWHKQSNVHD